MGVRRMTSTLSKGRLRRAGMIAATSAACWMGFAGIGSAAYASPADNTHGNSAAAHDNGRGNDDTKNVETSTAPTTTGSDHSTGTAGTSGDPTQPQPPSNADQNPGGANGQCPGGPYCSTRDGAPSGNGNGTGKATGKPCAGCVGKADNKNPKGQMPGGSDHNAGYECDRNHGIGRSNPAHTGCQSGSSTPPPSCSGDNCGGDDDSSTPPGDDKTPCTEGNMTAACTPSTPPTHEVCASGEMVDGACVLGISLHRPTAVEAANATPAATVSALHATRTPQVGALPFTGSATDQLLELGLAALVVGTGCAMLGRRRTV